jgi:hypothetical protein
MTTDTATLRPYEPSHNPPNLGTTVTGAYMLGVENGKKVGRAEALEEAANLIDSVGFTDVTKNQALTLVSEMIRYLAKTEPK